MVVHWCVMMNQVPSTYAFIPRLFHWGMALLILGLLIAGFVMGELPVSSVKFEVYGLHKSVGLVVLMLGVMRLIWRFTHAYPLALPTHAGWEKFLAKTIHVVLYITIFAMPLSGWVMTSAGGYPVQFFGLVDVPMIWAKDEAVFEAMKLVHLGSALILVGALGLHVAGALKHHLIDRDETALRMGARPVLVVPGVLMLMGAGILAAGEVVELAGREYGGRSHDSVQVESEGEQNVSLATGTEGAGSKMVHEWRIDPARSHLGISFMQYGQKVEAVFEVWDGQIIFDSAYLEDSYVRIEIDTASFKTGSEDRDGQVLGTAWFDSAVYPQAVFESESFMHVEANQYEVQGLLTLRGVEKAVSFPFFLEIGEGDDGQRQADMQAEFGLGRLYFGVGQGEWEATDVIGNTVDVRVQVHAETVNP